VTYRGADKSLARRGMKQARKHVRDAHDFNNIKMRAVIKFFFFLQGKVLKEIHAILKEILASFVPGRAKDLSAPLLLCSYLKARRIDFSLSHGFPVSCNLHRYLMQRTKCWPLSMFTVQELIRTTKKGCRSSLDFIIFLRFGQGPYWILAALLSYAVI